MRLTSDLKALARKSYISQFTTVYGLNCETLTTVIILVLTNI